MGTFVLKRKLFFTGNVSRVVGKELEQLMGRLKSRNVTSTMGNKVWQEQLGKEYKVIGSGENRKIFKIGTNKSGTFMNGSGEMFDAAGKKIENSSFVGPTPLKPGAPTTQPAGFKNPSEVSSAMRTNTGLMDAENQARQMIRKKNIEAAAKAKPGESYTIVKNVNGKDTKVTVTKPKPKDKVKKTTQTNNAAKKSGGFFSNHPILGTGAVVGGGIMAGSILQDHNDRSAY